MATKSPHIKFTAATLNEEFDTLQHVIKRLPYFSKNGYSVALPDNTALCENETYNNPEAAYQLFKSAEYNIDYFKKGLELLESKKVEIEKLLKKLVVLNNYWDFKVFSSYKIELTKYGPGGFYDETNGTVVLLTKKNGEFTYDPIQTILHEITHIGIEDTIVKKYKLSHEGKERLVDLLVKIVFSKEFPNYYVQSFSDTRLDSYITPDSLKIVPNKIKEYINEKSLGNNQALR